MDKNKLLSNQNCFFLKLDLNMRLQFLPFPKISGNSWMFEEQYYKCVYSSRWLIRGNFYPFYVQDVFWTSCVRSIYVLCLRGNCLKSNESPKFDQILSSVLKFYKGAVFYLLILLLRTGIFLNSMKNVQVSPMF